MRRLGVVAAALVAGLAAWWLTPRADPVPVALGFVQGAGLPADAVVQEAGCAVDALTRTADLAHVRCDYAACGSSGFLTVVVRDGTARGFLVDPVPAITNLCAEPAP